MLSIQLKDDVKTRLHFGRTLGISRLRFLPKANGVCSIVNFLSKVNLSSHLQLSSVNEQLRDVFHVLNYEKVWCTCDTYKLMCVNALCSRMLGLGLLAALALGCMRSSQN